MINVCIPTLNSIDTFWKCVESLRNSSVGCNIYVIDNGGLVKDAFGDDLFIHRPTTNLGVAGSWNWFIDNVPSLRLITNDDIVFDTNALDCMIKVYDGEHLVAPENLASPFSCFILPDNVVQRVGRFDEWISPRYAYFEDNDYSHRMSMERVGIIKAPGAFVEHVGSSTYKHFDLREERVHHDKFRAARARYVKKWGGEPGHEKYSKEFNGSRG